MDMKRSITIENYFEKLDEHSIMMMCCMPMCRLPGMGGLPM